MTYSVKSSETGAAGGAAAERSNGAVGKLARTGGGAGGGSEAGGAAGAGLLDGGGVDAYSYFPDAAAGDPSEGGGAASGGGGGDAFDFGYAAETAGGEASGGAETEATGGQAGAGAASEDESAREGEKVQQAAAAGVSGGGGGPLPHGDQIQESFGPIHDLSGVAAYTGGSAGQAAEAIGAEAYATGDAVAFSAAPDLHTAAHEAAHVVQQRAGMQLAGGVGTAGDAYERQADAVADRVVAGQSAADLLPSTRGAAPAAGTAPVQRRIRLAGTTLDQAGATRAASGLVTGQLRDLVAERAARGPLIRETVNELHGTSDLHTFATADVLGQNVRQRVLTSQYMRRSQGTTTRSTAFSYPENRGDGTLGISAKVNDAALSYWSAPLGGHNYFWELSSSGRANAYQAIMALFVEHTVPRRRSLMHCDYVVSVIRVRGYAESIGAAEFNRLVSSGALNLRLTYDMFANLEGAQGRGGRTAPLQTVTVASESDLVVGDHVVFWNHPSYDPLIEGTTGVWRLENAIVIDRQGGQMRYQGHGYFSPVNKEHLIRGMLHHYNIHIDDALTITRRIDRGGPDATAARRDLATRFPKVFQRSGGRGWEIRGTGFGSVATVRELRHLTAAEAPGLVSPITNTIQARRPVETAL